MSESVTFDPFASALDGVAPLTAPQRELWMASAFGEDVSLAFNESVSLRLRGALDVEALAAALDALVARHECLRATVSPDAQLLVSAPAPRALERSTESVEAVAAKAVTTPFDLGAGPLLRATLCGGGTDHTLVLTAHHVVLDGWSTGVILKELGALYDAHRAGRAAGLPDASSWTQYAEAQAVRDDQEDVCWWLESLRAGGLPPPLELPTDRPRPAFRTYRSRRVDRVVPAAEVAVIEAAAHAQGASHFAFLFAGFAHTLARLQSEPGSVVIGVPAAGQAGEGRRGRTLVGHAVHLLPVRVTPALDAPFAADLGVIKDTLYEAFDHQGLTYGRLLEELALPRDPSRAPLVSVQFNLDQALDPASLGFAGLEVTLRTNPRAFENFELFVNCQRASDGLVIECQYNADLFDEATVSAWLDGWTALLGAAAREPHTVSAALPLLGAEARARLDRWGRGAPITARGTLPELVAASAARFPDRVAVRGGGSELTYGALDRLGRQVAARLRAVGVQPGDAVALAVSRGPMMVAAALGIGRARAAYVPIDADYPADRVLYMLDHSKARVVVTDAATREKLPVVASGSGPLVVDLDVERSAIASLAGYDGAPLPEDIGYVIYTSGSTGRQKGVEVPHGAIAAFLEGIVGVTGLSSATRLVAVTTLSFDIAVLELYAPLVAGGTVTIATRDDSTDGVRLGALLADGADVMQATPATWRLLLDAGWRPGAGFRALVGGEAFPADLRAPLLERCAAVINLYGPTETTVWSTSSRVDGEGTIAIGSPLPGEKVWVVDRRGQACPPGVPGELWIGGQGVTRGYRFDPDQTAARFVDGPDGSRAYRTGDLVRWRPDGQLVFERRLDTQVKVRGFRIELGEIESALAQHPNVAQAVATVFEPRPGDTRLAAYVVLRPERTATTAALREHVQGLLPAYMVPQHVVFLTEVPLTPNGKVDRKALPRPDADVGRELVAPRTDTERALVRVLSEVLGVRKVSVTDDFFELGGHSILATRLVARLREELGVELPLRRVFETPGVAALASHLDAVALLSAPSAAPSADTEELEF